MCLPLDDKANPLYEQPVSTQINYLINWEQHFSSPCKLFSLGKHYTKKEVAAAYRQLSKRIHPDKNPEIPTAGRAFTILNAAKEFLEFELLSDSAKRAIGFKPIANNPFLKTAPHYHALFGMGFGNPFTRSHDVSSQILIRTSLIKAVCCSSTPNHLAIYPLQKNGNILAIFYPY